MKDVGCRVKSSGFRISHSGFSVQRSGFMVSSEAEALSSSERVKKGLGPLLSECGTCKTAKAGLWPWLSSKILSGKTFLVVPSSLGSGWVRGQQMIPLATYGVTSGTP